MLGSPRIRAVLTATVLTAALTAAAAPANAADLTIATVNNGDMVVMQKLSTDFEQKHPDIHLKWVVLEENVLRQRLTTDIATKAGQFDILTVGNYEVPIWAKQGWIVPMDLPAAYDVDDLLKPVRTALTVDGKLYALPFYAESAMTYYRKDLFDKAGIKMPDAPTYAEIRTFADKITDKATQTYGMCLRGKPGWGENMAYVTSLVNAEGGRWFDMDWKPTLDSTPWKTALDYYDGILKADGPPGAASNGFNENLALFASGHCGMWIDATVAGGMLFDPKQSQVADKVGFAPHAHRLLQGRPHLALVLEPSHPDDLQAAGRRQGVHHLGHLEGTTSSSSPPRTAGSPSPLAPANPPTTTPTIKRPLPFAAFVLNAIDIANPNGQTEQKRPYTGAQFVAIPEFQGIGTQVGQTVAATLTGQQTVESALKAADSATERTMKQAGYPKK